jgi:hypothetical protein
LLTFASVTSGSPFSPPSKQQWIEASPLSVVPRSLLDTEECIESSQAHVAVPYRRGQPERPSAGSTPFLSIGRLAVSVHVRM